MFFRPTLGHPAVCSLGESSFEGSIFQWRALQMNLMELTARGHGNFQKQRCLPVEEMERILRKWINRLTTVKNALIAGMLWDVFWVLNVDGLIWKKRHVTCLNRDKFTVRWNRQIFLGMCNFVTFLGLDGWFQTSYLRRKSDTLLVDRTSQLDATALGFWSGWGLWRLLLEDLENWLQRALDPVAASSNLL